MKKKLLLIVIILLAAIGGAVGWYYYQESQKNWAERTTEKGSNAVQKIGEGFKELGN